MAFLDHFSHQAQAYAQARPNYPAELFDYLQNLVGAQARVWEAACGSGQATVDLAARFAWVEGSEPAAAALALAPKLPNVRYQQLPAEQCDLASASVDLVVVAQAMHWFDQAAFFAQVRRVLRPGGVLAVWCYQDVQLDDELAPAYAQFAERIRPFWPAQRALVDNAYADTQWPGSELSAPRWPLQAQWSAARFLGYCRSYSATARFLREVGIDPVNELELALSTHWQASTPRPLRWTMPLFLRRCC